MSRHFFSTTARSLFRVIGFQIEAIPDSHRDGFKIFTSRGGSAEQKLGTISEVMIKSRNGNPVHLSHYSPDDGEMVISVRIIGSKDTKTCHVYSDGTGTAKKGDDRE